MSTGFLSIKVLVALAVVSATVSVSHAQQAPRNDGLMFDPGALKAAGSDRPLVLTKPETKPEAKPQPKHQATRETKSEPKRAAKTAAPRNALAGELRLSDTIDGTVTGRRVHMSNPKPATVADPGFGRVPLESGTFGFQTETNAKSYELPDGTRMRGMDKNIKSPNEPSYFGLSVRVPTDSKMFSPLPLRAD